MAGARSSARDRTRPLAPPSGRPIAANLYVIARASSAPSRSVTSGARCVPPALCGESSRSNTTNASTVFNRTTSKGRSLRAVERQVLHEPVRGEVGHDVERARFLEQMGRSRDDLDAMLAAEPPRRLTVELEAGVVVPTHDQACRRAHVVEPVVREIGPTAARHDRLHGRSGLGRRPQRRARAGAGAEVPERKSPDRRRVEQKRRRRTKAIGEQGDIENVRAVGLLVRRKEVEQQRSESRIVERACHRLIARAVPAAAAPVRERDEPEGTDGNRQLPRESPRPGRDLDVFVDRLLDLVVGRAGSVISTQTTSSASRCSDATVSRGATGTASTTRSAPRSRATRMAARAVPPVARPSSTMMTVRPPSGSAGRPLRSRTARSSTSARSRVSTSASWLSDTPAWWSTSGFRTRTPSSPTAPIPSSGWYGTPSFRTIRTSSGAPSASATSYATRTTSRGRPRTSGDESRRPETRSASCRPASRRSRKGIGPPSLPASPPPMPALPEAPDG